VEASVRKRRDCLEVVISGRSEGERIEITFWEDEATVRANGVKHSEINTGARRLQERTPRSLHASVSAADGRVSGVL